MIQSYPIHSLYTCILASFTYQGAKNSTKAKSMLLIRVAKLLSVSSITSEPYTTPKNARKNILEIAIVKPC